jgi:hypothetical protein
MSLQTKQNFVSNQTSKLNTYSQRAQQANLEASKQASWSTNPQVPSSVRQTAAMAVPMTKTDGCEAIIPKDYRYIAYFGISMSTLLGCLALYLGVTWKAPTDKNRWGHQINGSPGKRWYYLLVAVICFLISGFSYAGYIIS